MTKREKKRVEEGKKEEEERERELTTRVPRRDSSVGRVRLELPDPEVSEVVVAAAAGFESLRSFEVGKEEEEGVEDGDAEEDEERPKVGCGCCRCCGLIERTEDAEVFAGDL